MNQPLNTPPLPYPDGLNIPTNHSAQYSHMEYPPHVKESLQYNFDEFYSFQNSLKTLDSKEKETYLIAMCHYLFEKCVNNALLSYFGGERVKFLTNQVTLLNNELNSLQHRLNEKDKQLVQLHSKKQNNKLAIQPEIRTEGDTQQS